MMLLIAAILALHYSATALHFDNNDILSRNGSDVAALSTSTNTYAQAVNYGKTHPTRDGGSWNGWQKLFSFSFVYSFLISFTKITTQVCFVNVACRKFA